MLHHLEFLFLRRYDLAQKFLVSQKLIGAMGGGGGGGGVTFKVALPVVQ
jgi:hypothetical protein